MNRYKIYAIGKRIGSTVSQNITAWRTAHDEEEAAMALYDEFEHVISCQVRNDCDGQWVRVW